MIKRLALGGAAAAVAVAALFLGGVLRETGSAAPARVSPVASATAPDAVVRLQEELRANPNDVRSLGLLGLAYQQRARETGDPSFYAKSAGVLRRAVALAPDDLVATSGLGSLALARHRFGEALVLGRRALALSPSTARSYGVVGDALVELGRYREAFAAFDSMAALKPTLAAYARISYARELLGDWSGAVSAMRLAVDSAVGAGEPSAWTHVQLGKLFWNRGRLGAAAREYRAALAAFPGYVYAFDALAQVEAARGRLGSAIRFERRAAETIPLPQFVAALGDLYRLRGNERLAQSQYATIGVIERLLRANGVRTDLETALFEADHGRPDVALARLARRSRPSIDGDDVLGWTLVRAGRCAEGLPHARRALRLGTQDALKLFHLGMAQRCAGDRAAARTTFRRALALNPHFSVLWSPLARRYAR